METENLGAIIQRDYRNITHRDRDNLLGMATQRPESQIQDISWLTVNFQRNTPMCGPHTGTHLKALLDKPDTGVNRYSPAFLWRALKLTDGFPPNQGTTIEAIMKALRSYGVCDWDVLPTDFTLSETAQAYTQLTEAQKDNAQPRIIKSFAVSYNPTHEAIRDILFADKVAVLLLQFDNSWWSGTVHEKNGAKTYGHFVCAYGYDKDYLYVIDSADAINPYKKLGRGFEVRAVASAVDLPDEEIKRLVQRRSLLQKIVELKRKLALMLK